MPYNIPMSRQLSWLERRIITKAPKKVITAYDLKHTWAVRVATDNEWEHISDEQAAMAMGHSLEIHRSHYKRWAGTELKKKKFFDSVQIPIK